MMKVFNELPDFTRAFIWSFVTSFVMSLVRSFMPMLSRLAFSPFIVVVSRPLHLLALIHHFMTHSLGAL